MASELQSRNKVALNRKKMEDRCQKIAQYSAVLKDRFKSKSPPANRTVTTDRDQSGLSDPLDPVNRTQLGN